ncbi:metallophosphoesterase 1 isoform X2 [Chiloscyllium plagiosum]|uniref:metallophosphoesterase 1 isoform X2 n=1 Tax=Chiloscyllium plagiosum TaxID=36176 RepID=UPI001CB86120|nr:metallophosphoesterase 1 isoform X2 [Chiloscyllium plagiosum]
MVRGREREGGEEGRQRAEPAPALLGALSQSGVGHRVMFGLSIHPIWTRTLVRRWLHQEVLLWPFLKLLALGTVVALFCELGIYYAVILRCDWPPLRGSSAPVLKALFLADTHLLGALRGHWFDKLRREWQMERAFQTASWLFQPDVVFVLGDLFDEGKWSSPEDFRDDVKRFQMMFRHSSSTELFVVVGNHDIGFHHEMDWYKLQRFEGVFNFTSAKVVTRKGINFVLVNSIALQGDGCSICSKVENDLQQLSLALNCSRQLDPSHSSENCKGKEIFPPSAPILLQHYPLYRVSDEECTGEDSASPEEKQLLFREKYDTLSLEASKKASITATDFTLAKCFMPRESTVITIYLAAGVLAINLLLFHFRFWQWLMHYLIDKHKST